MGGKCLDNQLKDDYKSLLVFQMVIHFRVKNMAHVKKVHRGVANSNINLRIRAMDSALGFSA